MDTPGCSFRFSCPEPIMNATEIHLVVPCIVWVVCWLIAHVPSRPLEVKVTVATGEHLVPVPHP
jgi:hypothetical protein